MMMMMMIMKIMMVMKRRQIAWEGMYSRANMWANSENYKDKDLIMMTRLMNKTEIAREGMYSGAKRWENYENYDFNDCCDDNDGNDNDDEITADCWEVMYSGAQRSENFDPYDDDDEDDDNVNYDYNDDQWIPGKLSLQSKSTSPSSTSASRHSCLIFTALKIMWWQWWQIWWLWWSISLLNKCVKA